MRTMLATTATVGALFLVLACSSTSTSAPVEGATNAEAGTDAGPRTTGEDAPAKASEPRPSDAGAGEARCDESATSNACTSCCVDAHAKGAKTYQTLLVQCACTAEMCQKECAATVCGATVANADDECSACLSAKSFASACLQPVADACAADQDCSAFASCRVDARCHEKPEE